MEQGRPNAAVEGNPTEWAEATSQEYLSVGKRTIYSTYK